MTRTYTGSFKHQDSLSNYTKHSSSTKDQTTISAPEMVLDRL